MKTFTKVKVTLFITGFVGVFIAGFLLKPYKFQKPKFPDPSASGQKMYIADTYIKPHVLFHGSSNRNIKIFTAEPTAKKSSKYPEAPSIFATPHIGFASCYLFDWKNIPYHQGSFDYGPFFVVCSDKEKFMNNDKGGVIYVVSSKNFYSRFTGWHLPEWVNTKPVKPLYKLKFDSAFEAMLHFGVQVFFVDKKTFDKIYKNGKLDRTILMNLEKSGVSENRKRKINPMPLFEY